MCNGYYPIEVFRSPKEQCIHLLHALFSTTNQDRSGDYN
jgi:hypothetical protein